MNTGHLDFAERLEIVLVRPLQAGNVGASARAMKNMGLRHLTLVAPNLDHPERAHWMAPAADDVLEAARRVATVEEAVEGCTLVIGTTARGRQLRWPAAEPPETARRILDHPGRVALLFGPEDKGLSNDDLRFAHLLATIPTDLHASLNLAQAVLLLGHHVFELARARGYAPAPHRTCSRRGQRTHLKEPMPPLVHEKDVPADASLIRRAADRAVSVLERTSYLHGRTDDQVGLTLFHLLSRANPTVREVEILLGMVAKVGYVLDHPDTILGPSDPAGTRRTD